MMGVRNRLLFVLNLVIYMCISITAQSSASTAGTPTPTPPTPAPTPAEFVKSSCRATRYPALCVECLIGFTRVIQRSDRQIAITALSVSISRSRSAALLVKKMSKAKGLKHREYMAVQDCIEMVGDSVESLRQSVSELGRVGEQDFQWHMSNVQTWVSAALTNDDTCLDGFSDSSINGNVKSAIRDTLLHVAQVTSNALALVNRFASRHQRHTP